jgi:DNA mismatch repair protein MutL
LRHWNDFFTPATGQQPDQTTIADTISTNTENSATGFSSLLANVPQLFFEETVQIHQRFLLIPDAQGFLLVHQQNAHERILYERFNRALEGKPIATQQSLFPVTLDLAAADAILLVELLPELNALGFHLEPFGNNTFVIQGSPADVLQGNEKTAIEKMLEQYKHFSNDLRYSKREKLLRSMAWQQSIKAGTSLSHKECVALAEDLFACETPNITPTGKPTYIDYNNQDLNKLFGR